MTEQTGKAPIHLWVVGVIALLWEGMGVFDYIATQFQIESYMSQFTPEQKAYFYGFPSWAVAVWAIAVWGSLAGAILLLLRKRWAMWCFVVALAGLATSSIYSFVLSDGAAIMGQAGVIFTAIIWATAIFLVVYSWRMSANGVLR